MKFKNIFMQIEANEQAQSKALVLLVFIMSIAYLLFQVSDYAYDLVFSDQIDLFMGYMREGNLNALFLQQHGPHRQGVGAIMMLSALELANWDMRVLSYLTVLIMAVSTFFLILAAWLKSIPLLPSIAIVVLSLSLGSIELLTVTPNISHSALPVLFSCMLLWVMLKYGLTGTWSNIVILLIVVLSLFTGFGIFLFFSYFLVLTVKLISDFVRKEKFSKKYLSIIMLSYALLIASLTVFFMGYSFSRGEGCAGTALLNIGDVLKYSFAVASIPLGGSSLGDFSVPVGFLVILMFSVTAFIALWKLITLGDVTSFALLVLILASGSFVINVAIGRHCLGIDSAYASRYYQLSTLGIFGSLLLLSVWCRKRSSIIVHIVSIVLIGATLAFVNPRMGHLAENFYRHKNNFALCVEQENSIYDCNEKFSIYPPDGNRLGSLILKMNAEKRVMK